MSNLYYTESGAPVTLNRGTSSTIRSEYILVRQGFDKLPTPTQLSTGSANYLVDTGSADAYVVTFLSPLVPASYTDGMAIVFKATNTNTGASTINVNALGVKSIKRFDGTALQAGDISTGNPFEIRYNSTAGCFYLTAALSYVTQYSTAAAASASAASASATAAATSATSAINAPGTSATSTTSVAIATGSKSFTIQTGKAYVVGQVLMIAYTTVPSNYMVGQITAHDNTTGALTVNVLSTNGSGTYALWTIALAATTYQEATSGEMSAGTETAMRTMSPALVATAISNLVAAPTGSKLYLYRNCGGF